MVTRLDIEIWEIGKSDIKRGAVQEKGCVHQGKGMGAAAFCGTCVCLSVFLL
jgi:hypothetical protein